MDNRNQRSDNLFALVVVLRVELAVVVLSRACMSACIMVRMVALSWLHFTGS